jgi:hypothetical protein
MAPIMLVEWRRSNVVEPTQVKPTTIRNKIFDPMLKLLPWPHSLMIHPPQSFIA